MRLRRYGWELAFQPQYMGTLLCMTNTVQESQQGQANDTRNSTASCAKHCWISSACVFVRRSAHEVVLPDA
jgi:hypothetical protein